MGVAAKGKVSAALLVWLWLFSPALSHAEAPRLDWSRGLLIGTGISVGDLRSPTRQLARVKAERQAKTRCRASLMQGLAQIPGAKGQKVKTVLGKRYQKVIHSLSEVVFPLDTDYSSDGSVVVTMALPLDALRSALYGADALESDLPGPQVLLVDARKSSLKPRVGVSISDGEASYQGPTLFFRDAKAAQAKWLGDGEGILANRFSAGVLRVAPGTLKGKIQSRPLVLILYTEAK